MNEEKVVGKVVDITEKILFFHKDATVKDLAKVMDKVVATGSLHIPNYLPPSQNLGTYTRNI